MEVEFLEVTDSCVILGEKNLGITLLSREYVFLKDHTLLLRVSLVCESNKEKVLQLMYEIYAEVIENLKTF